MRQNKELEQDESLRSNSSCSDLDDLGCEIADNLTRAEVILKLQFRNAFFGNEKLLRQTATCPLTFLRRSEAPASRRERFRANPQAGRDRATAVQPGYKRQLRMMRICHNSAPIEER
jgi:hypothetical protein